MSSLPWAVAQPASAALAAARRGAGAIRRGEGDAGADSLRAPEPACELTAHSGRLRAPREPVRPSNARAQSSQGSLSQARRQVGHARGRYPAPSSLCGRDLVARLSGWWGESRPCPQVSIAPSPTHPPRAAQHCPRIRGSRSHHPTDSPPAAVPRAPLGCALAAPPPPLAPRPCGTATPPWRPTFWACTRISVTWRGRCGGAAVLRTALGASAPQLASAPRSRYPRRRALPPRAICRPRRKGPRGQLPSAATPRNSESPRQEAETSAPLQSACVAKNLF